MVPATIIISRLLDEADAPPAFWRIAPRAIDYGARRASARGLFRIFNAAGYRFYRSNSGPPLETDAPFATNATLPYQPADTYADGTWYLSVSYFNGVLDSGFLPLGPRGESFLQLTLSAGAVVATPPGAPVNALLRQDAGGVVTIVALYARTPDQANAATQWAIAYTTDGSAPAAGAPTLTPPIGGGPLSILTQSLPAQAAATVVKVQLQTRRPLGSGYTYSAASPLLSITVATAGPSAPLGEG